MYCRRIFGTTPIPRTMYSRLHIASSTQAKRVLPSLVSLSTAVERSSHLTNSLRMMTENACAPVSELSCTDPFLLQAITNSLAPIQLSFLKLLELWGIGRPVCRGHEWVYSAIKNFLCFYLPSLNRTFYHITVYDCSFHGRASERTINQFFFPDFSCRFNWCLKEEKWINKYKGKERSESNIIKN